MNNDKQCAIRLPESWYMALSEAAPEVVPEQTRTGPRGQFAEVVRVALAEFAANRGIELEGGTNGNRKT